MTQQPVRQLFLRHVAQTSPSPLGLEVEKAEGLYLYGTNGEKWLDLISGISVSNVGHRHPKVIEAIHAQLEKYMHLMVYGEFIQSPQVKLAAKLASIISSIDSVYFTNSGTEAIEGAIKLARRYTGRKKIFSFKDAYHGSTNGALSLMSNEYFSVPFYPLLPDVFHLTSGNHQELTNIDLDTAAVFVELFRGEAGAEVVDPTFLQDLRSRCTEVGALLVVDEIQTGFGRTGPFFASQGVGIIPDILVVAKGMGGGMPIGAFMSSKKIMDSLSDNPVLGHITTFGGNAVCCAASLATFDIIQSLKTEERIPKLESVVRKTLVHPAIQSIRGKGMLLALVFPSDEFAQRVIAACGKKWYHHRLVPFCGKPTSYLSPLTITEAELLAACHVVLEAVDECYQLDL
ncbi:MAG: aspartate aminotransferase family protein [Bacteroidetes bacterium]|nr:aspartate aminotransferase family protein [Bacteroidota bacterium]